MPIYDSDVSAAKSIIGDQEKIIATARQRSFGPGMAPVNPTTVVLTDKRVLIVNRTTLRLRKDIESIPFESIVSVRLEQGLISASIEIRVGGQATGVVGFLGKARREGQISGLRKKDALAIYEYLNNIVDATQKRTQNY
jgi:hypothetical protein